jgi:hypothetical protein
LRNKVVEQVRDIMTKSVLLLGVKRGLIDEMTEQIGMRDFKLFDGTGIDDARSVLAKEHIDHVIIGGGIDLETRLEVIRELFRSSDRTTVHLKDQISGPEGFVPFAHSVLSGLKGYEFVASPNARSEIPPKA